MNIRGVIMTFLVFGGSLVLLTSYWRAWSGDQTLEAVPALLAAFFTLRCAVVDLQWAWRRDN